MTPEELLKWRKSLGLTQRAAAQALGVVLTTYQSMERGRHWTTGKPVTLDKRTALACSAVAHGLPPFSADDSE